MNFLGVSPKILAEKWVGILWVSVDSCLVLILIWDLKYLVVAIDWYFFGCWGLNCKCNFFFFTVFGLNSFGWLFLHFFSSFFWMGMLMDKIIVLCVWFWLVSGFWILSTLFTAFFSLNQRGVWERKWTVWISFCYFCSIKYILSVAYVGSGALI